MRESRRCISEPEFNVSDIGLMVCVIDGALVFPAWRGDDQRTERNTTAMTVATEKDVELCGFIGAVFVIEEIGKFSPSFFSSFELSVC